MTTRSLGLLPAVLAIAAPLHAAPAPPVAAPLNLMVYHIERHGQQVTIKDANEKTLTTFSDATPLLQGLLSWSATSRAANTPRSLALTLKDQNGRNLWSTPVAVVYPQSISVGSYDDTGSDTQLVVRTTQANPADPDYLPASGFNFGVGTDGRLVSFGAGSRQYKYAYETQGFSVVNQEATTVIHGDFVNKRAVPRLGRSGLGLHLNPDGTVAMQINGKEVEVSEPL